MKTRNSLFTSVIALVLCVAMLAGTTFAWFSDIVASKDNVIQSGNLNISMEWANDFDATTWQDATEGAIFTHDNWEPGYTDVKYIKITNNGDLNLKWRLTLEAEGTVTELSDVVGVYCVNPATAQLTSIDGLTSAGTLTNVLNNKNVFAPTGALVPDQSVIIAIALHMSEDAGNTYQNTSLCDEGFSVKLVAAQDVGDSDSFGDDYDKDAEWPEFKMNFEATKSLEGIRRSTISEDELATEVTIFHESGAKAIVPAGTKLAEGATELKFTGKNVEANGNFADTARSYDIHIEGIADDNTTCITVFVGQILEPGLSTTEVKLYHEEVLMTRVDSVADFTIKNQYTYNAQTGAVVLYVDNFSVFSAVKSTASKWEDGTEADTSWYNENDTEFVLNDVADFLGFRDLVDGGNTFAGKTVTLGTDIDLNNKLFNPIGGGWAYNGGKTFNGTFDGGNHIIYNIYVNGWELDATEKHSGTSMGAGLFSSIHNATIKNLAISGAEMTVETTSIGVVVGCAQGQCTFENIIVSDAVLGNYQMRNGGIVGDIYVIESDGVSADAYSHIFKNIVVDSTVKLCSMWGDFDTGNGGVIGGKYGSAKVLMQDVVVAAELDVFSDVTAAYQWYAYRRCGMLIGYTGQNSPKQATNAAADFLTCENVSVYYGDWVNYTYYQFADQTDAGGNRLWNSNYPWVRAQASDYNGPFSNVRYGNPVINGVKINTVELADANKTAYTPIIFNQLYGGGQGVYGCNEHTGVTISNRDKKTVYIKNDAEWENPKLYYWFANGEDTWATLIDGITLSEENGVYRVNVPVYAYGFKIIADGENSTETFYVSDVIDGALYNINAEHIHDYQWIVETPPTYEADGVKYEECTGCHGLRNVNTPIAMLTCEGHTPLTKVEAKAATCLEKGNTEYYKCFTCNRIYSDANGYFEIYEKDYEIPAHGHKINADGVCDYCGQGTITFKSGKTSDPAEIAPAIVTYKGEVISSLPTPILSNHTFGGWYLDNACTVSFNEGTTFSKSLTLYAKWTPTNASTTSPFTVLSFYADNSGWINEKGPYIGAIEDAGTLLGDGKTKVYPDIICLQNVSEYCRDNINLSSYGYKASTQNGRQQGVTIGDKKGYTLIFYKQDMFRDDIGSGFDNYHSYIVLERKTDGAKVVLVNAWFDNTNEANQNAQLNAMWSRVNGIWKDQNKYGRMPIIITGGIGAAPTDSNVYQSLTENSLFVDASKVAKSSTGANSAKPGDYILVSHHMQYAVESYNTLGLRNTSYPIVVEVALPDVCSSNTGGHLPTKTEANPATCFEAGNREYYTCSVCKKVYADAQCTIETTVADCVIPAFGGHEAGAAATCETAQTCIRCDHVFTPALGHAWTNDCDPDCNNSCGETREITHNYQWIEDSEGVQYEECIICHEKRDENTPIE